MGKNLIGIRYYSNEDLSKVRLFLNSISKQFGHLKLSSVYRVEDAGNLERVRGVQIRSGIYFCLKFEADRSAQSTLDYMSKSFEKALNDGASHESFDWTYLFSETEQLNSPKLTLPYPDLHIRPELLVPSAEIEPDLVHPFLNLSLSKIAHQFVELDWGQFVSQGHRIWNK